MIRHCRPRTAAHRLGNVCLLASGASAQHDLREYSLLMHSTIVGGNSVSEPARTWQLLPEQMADVEIANQSWVRGVKPLR